MSDLTLIVPYYSQPDMLQAQLAVIRGYPVGVRVIIVDDGSPIPVKIDKRTLRHCKATVSLYRIVDDIPWNRGQARNLGAYQSQTDWIIQVDTDHILPVTCLDNLLSKFNPDIDHWYRFPRIRIGKADTTRQKDSIPDNQSKGKIHPHQDSYLIRRDWFMDSPYDERYSGCLGGGTPFLARMTQLHGEPLLLPDNIHLEVYTMDKVKDASVTLDRDRTEYTRRRDRIRDARPEKMICQPWVQVF